MRFIDKIAISMDRFHKTNLKQNLEHLSSYVKKVLILETCLSFLGGDGKIISDI